MNSLLFIIIISYFYRGVLLQTIESCDSRIYCQGELLDVVQRARIFPDSKTFVDMKLIYDEKSTNENFHKLQQETNNNPTKDQIKNFVETHFEEANELANWTIPDYKKNPLFLEKIKDKEMKTFAQILVGIWTSLARKVKDEVKESPQQYSLIPVDNGFIIPGGRFKEFYYWDTYWIIRGLLLCEMYDTVKGMLENFLYLVEKYGFIPNGTRLYYLNRSQPPLLTMMIHHYIKVTKNYTWLRKHIRTIDKELTFWLNKRTVKVTKNGTTHTLARYASESGTPRPESYYEDVQTAKNFQGEEKKRLYMDIKSAAESGWDFSSRWFDSKNGSNTGNLTTIHTRRIVPVDLNAFLARSFNNLAGYYRIFGKNQKEKYWLTKYMNWRRAIKEVLYDQEDGIWYDYNIETSKLRKYFYPSQMAPLFTEVVAPTERKKLGRAALEYLKRQGVLKYEGGIPTSLIKSGEQWDFPNAWPPLQDVVISSLEASGDKEAQEEAKKAAVKWLKANYAGYKNDKAMYEKYDSEHFGKYAGGGEYEVQKGFGWTNGVVLMFINRYYTY